MLLPRLLVLFLALSVTSTQRIYAQEELLMTKLFTQLKLTHSDSTKASLYLKISKLQASHYPKEAISKAKMAHILAEKINNTRLSQEATILLAEIYLNPLNDLSKARQQISKLQQTEESAYTLKNQARILGIEGQLFAKANDYKRAQDAYYKQLSTYQILQDEHGAAQSHEHLGDLYFQREEYEPSLQQFLKALDEEKKVENSINKMQLLNKVSLTYGHLARHDQQLAYAEQALLQAQQLQLAEDTESISLNLGQAHLALNHEPEAKQYFAQALKHAKANGNHDTYARAALYLGQMARDNGQPEEALHWLHEALHTAEIADNIYIRKEVLQKVYQFYNDLGEDLLAYDYLKALTIIKDTLFSQEKNGELINQRIVYETDQQAREYKLLAEREKVQSLTIRNQRFMVYLLVLLSSIAAIGIIWLLTALRQKKTNNQRLAAIVKMRTKELENTNDQLNQSLKKLEKSNTELERFAYIASHDLKSPLRNINGFLGLIERKLVQPSDSIREYIDIARSNASHMHRLIEDVLEYSRVSQQDIQLTATDLNDIMKQVQTQLGTTPHQLSWSKLPVLQVASSQILQLLLNLVCNGLKYNQSKQPHVMVRVAKHPLPGNFTIEIRDNGIGIEEEYYEQIFQMFTRLHPKGDYPGTGIGLALCLKIMETHHGQIRLDSILGSGSIFYLDFPIASVVKNPTVPARESKQLAPLL